MNFSESISTCFKKCTNTNGRASLSEFWWFYLFCYLVNIVALLLFSLIGYTISGIEGLLFFLPICSFLCGIVNLFLMLAVTIRRLHDTGHSGFWYFIVFVPLIGPIWLLILLLTSNNEENKYGLPEY